MTVSVSGTTNYYAKLYKEISKLFPDLPYKFSQYF